MANVWDLEINKKERTTSSAMSGTTPAESSPATARLTTPKNRSFSLVEDNESSLLNYLVLSLDLFIEDSARTTEERDEVKGMKAKSLERLAEIYQARALEEKGISLAISLQNKALKWAYAAKECQDTPEREEIFLTAMQTLERLKQDQQLERERVQSQETVIMDTLKLLEEGEFISIPELTEATGVNKRFILSIANKWNSQGILTVKMEGKHRLYSLNKQFSITVEEAITAIGASSRLEEEIVSNSTWLEGVSHGKPRKGHPEGKVIYHILEVLKNVAELDCSAEEQKKLRLLAILHDSFKHMGSADEPI